MIGAAEGAARCTAETGVRTMGTHTTRTSEFDYLAEQTSQGKDHPLLGAGCGTTLLAAAALPSLAVGLPLITQHHELC